ncbi:MAG: hypothetical protein H0W78_04860 [Planctomycetes bacterium]|nr:hypothetical protein [Planctomycetota bacterium]
MHLSRTLLLAGCLGLTQAGWAEEEQTLTLDQLPPVVKEAVLKQANGAKIKEIEAETKKGKTVYEVNFGETEVTFDANGTVLRSKVEKDDDEDEDEKKDGKKHDKKHGKKGENDKDDKDDKDDDEDEDEDEDDEDKPAKKKAKSE